jgi:diguanylate cyclase (GGDEF)-like protein/PAS domain S-box-containing protein
LQAIIENEPECIKIVNAQGLLVQMNPAGLQMIEADFFTQVKDAPVLNVIAPEYREAFSDMHRRVIGGETVLMEFVVVGLKGGRRCLETHAVPMHVQGETMHLAVTRDITQRKQMEDQVRQMAFHDPLTNLPNRRLLLDRLGHAMASSKRSGCYLALMFLDLDNFKPLNDAHGHGVGDLLLIEVARRLADCVRQVDSVARLGGDEFVAMLGELHADRVTSIAQALAVAEKIRNALSQPYCLSISADGQTLVEHHCSVSIGLVVFAHQESNMDEILRHADMAMYLAKDAGRNAIRLYEEEVAA